MSLTSPSRTFVIGDIHGCYRSFMTLLERAEFNPKVDYLWCVGDVVNRGHDSLSVLKTLIDWGDHALVVLGNHDLYAIALLSGVTAKYEHTLHELLSSKHKNDFVDWLRARPIAFMNSHYFLVHAGIYPLWSAREAYAYALDLSEVISGPNFTDFLRFFYESGHLYTEWSNGMSLEGQRIFCLNVFLRMRLLSLSHNKLIFDNEDAPYSADTNEDFSKASSTEEVCEPWFKGLSESKMEGRKVIFGHWSRLGWNQGKNHLCVDTGCVWGNQLTMAELPHMHRWSVQTNYA